MSLATEHQVSAAEGDIAMMRLHVGRLPAGFVRTKLEESMRSIEVEVAAARRARSSANEFVVVEREEPEMPTMDDYKAVEECLSEAAREARTKLERAFKAGEACRPRSSHEAAALCVHALLVSKAPGFPGLRCIGVPTKATSATVAGFAAPVRDLDPGKLLPPGWNERPGQPAFKYRRDGTFGTPAEIIELRCHVADGSQQLLGLTLSSASRGELHVDELAVNFEGLAVPCSRFDELAGYVCDVVAPRLAPPTQAVAPAPIIVPPPPGQRDNHAGFVPPAFEPPLAPSPLRDVYPPSLDRGDDMIVGPSHPIFGGGPPSVAAPRFDPIVPGDFPPGPTFPGRPLRPRPRPKLPGEPNFDHLEPPGDGDSSMYS